MASEGALLVEAKYQIAKRHEESTTSISIPIPNSLPTGRCMFIRLHEALTDQRCTCASYRQKHNMSGAYCDCGHQASYHIYAQCFDDVVLEGQTKPNTTFKRPPAPLPSRETSSIDQIKALEQRLHTLEIHHAHEIAHWHQRLLQERHAHQQTLRQLQNSISAFSQFMDTMRQQQLDARRKFGEVEDRLDQVEDCQQRLFDKVVSVEDFGMMLEDRVFEVEELNGIDVKTVSKRDEGVIHAHAGSECDPRGPKRERR